MMIHEVTAIAGKFKKRKRVGRGVGSGSGKTSGRGQKGASARSGHSTRFQFEGGQMPFFRRMPKFGFSNAKFRTEFWAVNLGKILAHDDFKKGGAVNAETLAKAGIIRDASRDLKVLGGLSEGQTAVKVKLDITANRVSAAARKLVEDAGGKVSETGTRKDRVRGVDRNADDRTPKNLTKKLKKQAWHKARDEAFARGEVLKPKN
jgi:large subunit ribosomal protein L15